MHLQACSAAAAWLEPGLAGGQAYACNTGRCVPASSRRTREQEPGASLGSSEPEMPALPVNTQTDPSNKLYIMLRGLWSAKQKLTLKTQLGS